MDVKVSPEAHAWLEAMSHDTDVPLEGLVNQAVFSWAVLHGYATPRPVVDERKAEAVPQVLSEPIPTLNLAIPKGAPVVLSPLPELEGATDPVVPQAPRVFLHVEERVVPVDAEEFLIGRDVSCNLTLDAARVSRQHAVIVVTPELVEVRDLKSSNGTWFNGERVTTKVVADGDQIFFGDVLVRFELV